MLTFQGDSFPTVVLTLSRSSVLGNNQLMDYHGDNKVSPSQLFNQTELNGIKIMYQKAKERHDTSLG